MAAGAVSSARNRSSGKQACQHGLTRTLRTISAAMRGKRMVLDDRECRAEREILRWGQVLTVP
jgi:hypothetical protein